MSDALPWRIAKVTYPSMPSMPILHLVPENDLKEHEFKLDFGDAGITPRCWCGAVGVEDRNVVQHNAADGRDQFEGDSGPRKMS